MKFICKHTYRENGETQTWTVEVVATVTSPMTTELRISGRGSYFNAVIVRHTYGRFLCLTNLGRGCEIVDLSDTTWNTERVSKIVDYETDVATIVRGLEGYGEYLKEAERRKREKDI